MEQPDPSKLALPPSWYKAMGYDPATSTGLQLQPILASRAACLPAWHYHWHELCLPTVLYSRGTAAACGLWHMLEDAPWMEGPPRNDHDTVMNVRL